MDRLKLDLLGFDAGFPCDGPAAFANKVAELVEHSWDGGADVVLLPELLWMGLERFVAKDDPIRNVAALFEQRIWPDLRQRLSRPGKAAVLGTTPFVDESGALRNRAPVLTDGRALHQDKIQLTPWESAFTGGGPLRVWSFQGVRIAVVICLDIEIPEISAALRGLAVDLILVPSATETLMGVERVSRCADARSVELGCHVGLCHLLGNAESGLIDVNLGHLAAFSPSQAAFADLPRKTQTEVLTEGFHCLSLELDIEAIRRNREAHGETDPSKVIAAMPEIEFL
jgi:predicted amidohydrolase